MKTILKGLLILAGLFVSVVGFSAYMYKTATPYQHCVADTKVKLGIDFWKQDKGAEYLCSQPSIQGMVIKAKGQ